VRRCSAAGTHEGTAVRSTRAVERGLRIVDSLGVIFDDDDHIQGKESPVLLRNVVKPEDVHDPISIGRSALLRAPLLDLNSRPLLVEEILARTQTERLMKIFDLPTFSSTLEFLTMFALSTGRLLKASPISSPSFLNFKTQTDFHSFRVVLPTSLPWRIKYHQVLIDWSHETILFFSEPPALHAADLPSTVPRKGGQVAPGTETTGHAQIVNAFGAPFMLVGLFGEADVEAMDADTDSEPAAENIGMDIEDDARSGPAVRWMIVDDDSRCVLLPTLTLFPSVKQ
jgi:nuclear GTP-binding protein